MGWAARARRSSLLAAADVRISAKAGGRRGCDNALRPRSLRVDAIATRAGRCQKQLSRVLKLSWFSPPVTEALIDGRLPNRFDRKHLLEMKLPANWSEQYALFGLA